MRILFINPAMEKYTRQVSFPLGIMSIATYLNQNGHRAKIIDRTIKTTDIKTELETFRPDIIGVSVFSLKSFKLSQGKSKITSFISIPFSFTVKYERQGSFCIDLSGSRQRIPITCVSPIK